MEVVKNWTVDRIPVAVYFSSVVQTGLGDLPTLLYNGYLVYSQGVKQSRPVADHRHLAARLKKK